MTYYDQRLASVCVWEKLLYIIIVLVVFVPLTDNPVMFQPGHSVTEILSSEHPARILVTG